MAAGAVAVRSRARGVAWTYHDVEGGVRFVVGLDTMGRPMIYTAHKRKYRGGAK